MIDWHWSATGETGWKADRGLAYGDGVFETLYIAPRGPVLEERHRTRLLAGCRALGLPFSAAHWNRWRKELEGRGWLSPGGAEGHVVKIVVTRGSGGRGYRPPSEPALRVISSRSAMPSIPSDPVDLCLCRTRLAPSQSGAGFKTVNRLDQVLASREIPKGCFEGLMTDYQGRPVEGTRSNLFVFSKGLIFTPPKWQLAVAGVMRDALLERLPAIGFVVKEKPLTFAELRRCEGAFIANSIMGVLAVARIGCLQLPFAENISDIQTFTRQNFGI